MKIRPLFEIRASELKKRIEKRFLTAVLEPDRGSRGHYQGFGLGLAISKRAAEALGWSISLKSEVGKGTDFVIRFKPDSINEVDGNQ